MAQNKNQHYVPQFYFRFFSENGLTICTYNISNELVIEHATIKGQCSKDYFYSKDTKIEAVFSRLEGLANEKIKKIIANQSLDCLSNEDIENLKSYILFQHGRTKFAYDRENDMANYIFDLFKPKIYSEAQEANKNISWKSIKELKIISNSSITLINSMVAGILLSDLNISLLENKSKTHFIFSDNPVILFNSFFNKSCPHGTIGIASTGLQIFYPLNPRFMLFLYDANYYEVSGKLIRVSTNKQVQRLNGLQILHCDKNIYFADYKMKNKFIKRYAELKSKIPKEKNEYEIMGNRIADDGTYRELIRTSPPKIYYNLETLSFIKHKENTNPYGIRNQRLVDINIRVGEAVFRGEIKSMEQLDNFLKNLTA